MRIAPYGLLLKRKTFPIPAARVAAKREGPLLRPFVHPAAIRLIASATPTILTP